MASHEMMFDDAFNEAYGMVEFGDLSFEAATVLKECDPVAYRCAVSDYDCDGDPECDDCEPESDPYNVYALMDGAVAEEQSFADIEAAQEYWGELVRDYRTDARKGDLDADATIHLFECHGGNMIAEVHVSATDYLNNLESE